MEDRIAEPEGWSEELDIEAQHLNKEIQNLLLGYNCLVGANVLSIIVSRLLAVSIIKGLKPGVTEEGAIKMSVQNIEELIREDIARVKGFAKI